VELSELLPYILGAGGIAFLTAIFNAVQAYRASAETREAKAVENLERWRIEADNRTLQCLDDLTFERNLTLFWQRRAATLEFGLRQHGIDPPEMEVPPMRPAPSPLIPPPPPSEPR
jgi:hypothetical protein